MSYFVHKPEDIPQCEHWAILEPQTAYSPGYDKGDSDIVEKYVSYEVFTDNSSFQQELKRRIGRSTQFYTSPSVIGIHVVGVVVPATNVVLNELK